MGKKDYIVYKYTSPSGKTWKMVDGKRIYSEKVIENV